MMAEIRKLMEKILSQVDPHRFGIPENGLYRERWAEEIREAEALGAPNAYLEFVKRYGVGELSPFFYIDSQLKPFEGSTPDLHSENSSGRFLVFGDDLGESLYAFDPSENWEVVRIDKEDGTTEMLGSFDRFILDELEEIDKTLNGE